VKRTIIIAIAATALFSCKQKTEIAAPAAAIVTPPAATSSSPALPPGHPNIDSASAAAMPQSAGMPAAPSGNALTGKVLETLDAGGYTYVRIQTASGEEWAAVPQTKVVKGSTVTISVQMAMEKFESKTLKRTFDRVLFGTIGSSAAAAATSMPAMPPNHPPMTSASSVDSSDINVARAAGGKTVAEVWAEKGALKDKPVVVSGKVVKFLPSIMGKNWLHLRDGSGNAKDGNNDLTVTTNDVAKVGDVITIKGTLRTDKDFGSGYSYAVIVEEASIVK